VNLKIAPIPAINGSLFYIVEEKEAGAMKSIEDLSDQYCSLRGCKKKAIKYHQTKAFNVYYLCEEHKQSLDPMFIVRGDLVNISISHNTEDEYKSTNSFAKAEHRLASKKFHSPFHS